jgi:hypothetical protein
MDAWPGHVTDILGGDVCAALAYRTPAAGVVMTPVTTIGMFDEAARTVTTTTSFGNWKKLVRIDADDRVALIYHARDHSGVDDRHLVVVQGRASFPERADGPWLTPEAEARVERFLLPRKTGPGWDWLGREYYDSRIPITVDVHRIVVFADDGAAEPSEVIGAALPGPPAPQEPPAKGTAPRVPAKRYRKRLRRSAHTLVGYTDADGFPTAHRIDVRAQGDTLVFDAPALPAGGRRAGVLAHWFEPQLVGQGSVVLTGWLHVDDGQARYAPHTASGYAVPASPLLFHLGASLAAKVGYRQAVRSGHVRDGTWRRAS